MGLFHVQESSILILVPSETDLFFSKLVTLIPCFRLKKTPFKTKILGLFKKTGKLGMFCCWV